LGGPSWAWHKSGFSILGAGVTRGMQSFQVSPKQLDPGVAALVRATPSLMQSGGLIPVHLRFVDAKWRLDPGVAALVRALFRTRAQRLKLLSQGIRPRGHIDLHVCPCHALSTRHRPHHHDIMRQAER
jgi:hypothetical protein